MNKITRKLAEDLGEQLLPVVQYKDGHLVDISGHIIIASNGNVNVKNWHFGFIEHNYFIFDESTRVYIHTNDQAEELKNIVMEFYNKQMLYDIQITLNGSMRSTVIPGGNYHDTLNGLNNLMLTIRKTPWLNINNLEYINTADIVRVSFTTRPPKVERGDE